MSRPKGVAGWIDRGEASKPKDLILECKVVEYIEDLESENERLRERVGGVHVKLLKARVFFVGGHLKQADQANEEALYILTAKAAIAATGRGWGMNGKYNVHSWIDCIDAYVEPDGEWEACPHCELKPRTWTFNNGESTACGCWNSMYEHFSIHAESVMSVYKRTNTTEQYDRDALRKNWNHWCLTGEVLFEHAGKRTDGRW